MRDLDVPTNLQQPLVIAERLLSEAFDCDVCEIVRLGGGTVLAMYYDHRVCFDLNFFARVPPKVMVAIMSNAEKPLSTQDDIDDLEITAGFISFTLDLTAISIFSSPTQTDTPHSRDTKYGIELEPTPEILAKKLHGRIMTNGVFAERDFYDFCVVWKEDPEAYNAFME